MNSTRIISFTLCLGLACLLLMGNALAGTTKADKISYAREVGKADDVYTLPAGVFITRSMNVVRNNTQDFVLKATLDGGLEFDGGSPPVSADVALDAVLDGGGTIQVTLIAGGADGDTFADFFVDILTSFGSFPTIEIDTAGWTVQDPSNTLGSGGKITATIDTRNAADDVPFDTSGTPAADWLEGVFGVNVTEALTATTATIDVSTARLNFVAAGGDAATVDNGAMIEVDANSSGSVLQESSAAYALLAADTVDLVIEGDLSGITSIIWDPPDGAPGETLLSTDAGFDITNGVATLSIPGTNVSLTTPIEEAIQINVDGTTTLAPRTLQITVKLVLSGGTGGETANSRDLVAKTTLTVWDLNGTILIANFANGNNGLFNTRVYLFNPGSLAGDITIRVFTLPLSGATTLLGTVDLGSLGALSGRNIRLAEDILTPLAIGLPYTADGGNLVLEVTIEAEGVTGNTQVFQLNLNSFGIYNMTPL